MSKKIFWILSFMVGVSCANTPSVGHYNYQGSPEQRFPYENYKPHHHHNNNPGTTPILSILLMDMVTQCLFILDRLFFRVR